MFIATLQFFGITAPLGAQHISLLTELKKYAELQAINIPSLRGLLRALLSHE